MATPGDATETVISKDWQLVLPAWRATFHRAEPDWEYARVNALSRVIKPGMTVLDVGAEVADYAALFQQWVGQQGSVILVEPVAKVWPSMRQIFRLNNLQPPAKSFVGFAGSKFSAGDPMRADDYCDPKIYHGWPPAADREVVGEPGFQHLNENDAIPQRTLADIAGQSHIDIINMDTEGSELEILQGAEPLILRDKPTVFVSVHPAQLKGYGHTPGDVYDFMTSLGYYRLELARDHEIHVMFTSDPTEGLLL